MQVSKVSKTVTPEINSGQALNLFAFAEIFDFVQKDIVTLNSFQGLIKMLKQVQHDTMTIYYKNGKDAETQHDKTPHPFL